MADWLSGNSVAHINKVTIRWARLVLGWVTASGFNSRRGTLSWYPTSHPGQLRLAIPSWECAMSTSQRAVTPCGWGVKPAMVCVWMADKTVWSHCYTRAISQHFRDKGLITKRNINLSVYFTLLYLGPTVTVHSTCHFFCSGGCDPCQYSLWLLTE